MCGCVCGGWGGVEGGSCVDYVRACVCWRGGGALRWGGGVYL